jgi:diketogulonate reductase-like aldo/keto reductase
MQTVKLNNGVEIPVLGFGVFQTKNVVLQTKGVVPAGGGGIMLSGWVFPEA